MTRSSAKEIDPADADHREIGQGLLEEDMGPGSAMAHLYRGEIHRMKFWRERLDRTTNWAVVVISAILTWSFSRSETPHYVILIGMATLSVFLLIEARRYRGYDIWRSRVRTLQENVFAYGLDPSAGLPDPNWRERLSRDYRTPTLKITAEEAIAHRLRRVYLPLFAVLLAAWIVRITAFASGPWTESAAIGVIPGGVVAVVVALFYLAAIAAAVRPRTWYAKGELRTEDLRE
ncbi:hypothetical protein HAPAU_25930 [Halalkalicoccus paucihalophilus]|jgi:uncharacterized membrane protein|uniref:DUF2270 domain-containing protein n=1 Tax=Halalkalicoccus paucihalophilus TaxID=1008153 RepID=A0A151AE54_9EURY|nr:DUF2270 domain-containing protein [Halalkalicoccus paucihalophilus]KYH25915.1 hypothetical protein HAPAU_25930 [Halalkalicoccus paucihalophilus]